MRAITLLLLFVAAVSAGPYGADNKIVGGSTANIFNYPSISVLLHAPDGVTFRQLCGGSILNHRSILTAAHCFDSGRNVPARWRFRVGTAFNFAGGVLHNVDQVIRHPSYNQNTLDSDIAILRGSSPIMYTSLVQPASIASATYNLADNQVVWAVGWGATETSSSSDQLRHVQIWTINQEVCNQLYGGRITANMLCSGWLSVGGRGQCQGDSGGPLYHNGVVVGVYSWSNGCGLPNFPGVNARVSRFTSWIQSNA